MMRQLRTIQNITQQDRVTNKEIIQCEDLPSIADILIEKGLRWLGPIHRMNKEPLIQAVTIFATL